MKTAVPFDLLKGSQKSFFFNISLMLWFFTKYLSRNFIEYVMKGYYQYFKNRYFLTVLRKEYNNRNFENVFKAFNLIDYNLIKFALAKFQFVISLFQ